MNWNDETEAVVRKGQLCTTCGTSCYFVRLSDAVGLKLYGTELERDSSYVHQSVAAEIGVAPNAWQPMEIRGLEIPKNKRPQWWNVDFVPQILYGFLTEIVRIGYDSDNESKLEFRLKRQKQKAIDAGFDDIGDCHLDHNVGFRNDDTPLMFDWDERFGGAYLLTTEERKKIAKNYANPEYWI